MTEAVASVQDVATRVRVALCTEDLSAFGHLLDPAVRWGPPGDLSPPCQSRQQVLAWFKKGRVAGVRAEVTDVEVLGNRILVGMVVRGSRHAQDRGGRSIRWQVLTVRDGLITDIVGFEQRAQALAHAAEQTAP
jgi:hypothetical protein